MINTCSIKFLPKAYIGKSIRMTKDKNTVDFDNKPMTNLKIEDYGPLGFRISHKNLPKTIWVDFNQLPLTRLKIINGVIQDEITFVENIVNHQMQLIRTLDTEYIDLIYATKELEKKEDKIIPVTKAIPGQIYQGARCEEGTHMIFVGNFYTKDVDTKPRWFRHEKQEWVMTKGAPRKAFFAIPSNSLSYQEIDKLEKEYKCKYNDNPSHVYCKTPEEKAIQDNKIFAFRERENLCELAKKELIKNTPIRYRIIEYPITSKVIKNLIIVDDIDSRFSNIKYNKEVLRQEGSRYYDRYNKHNDEYFEINLQKQIELCYHITNLPNHTMLYESKVDIDKRFRKYVDSYGNQKVDDYVE